MMSFMEPPEERGMMKQSMGEVEVGVLKYQNESITNTQIPPSLLLGVAVEAGHSVTVS